MTYPIDENEKSTSAYPSPHPPPQASSDVTRADYIYRVTTCLPCFNIFSNCKKSCVI